MLYDEKPGDVFVWKSQGQPVEVMQFTGLRDANGKEIYEGDILEAQHDDGAFHLRVAYDEEYARYWFIDDAHDDYYAPDEFDQNEILVVGSVYENPELLELNDGSN
jgi:uncharacterized phage protein (TIGR01671 family)